MPQDNTSSGAPEAGGFRTSETTVSKLRFYSIGVVASNKPLKSKEIEVWPSEELPMTNGFLDDQTEKLTAEGTDASGKSYNAKVQMGSTIKAEWLPFCDSQRLTAPDVRRGESVVIYQFGDADKYYWTTLKNDNKLRKLETVIWAFSATKNEDDAMTDETSYFLEVSTHKKMVTFHTSQANGEKFGYDIQINADKSLLIVTDTAGNKFVLNSAETKLRLENASGSYLDITKQVAKLFTGQEINLETQRYTLKCQTSLVDASSSITEKAPTIMNQGYKSITLQAPKISAPK